MGSAARNGFASFDRDRPDFRQIGKSFVVRRVLKKRLSYVALQKFNPYLSARFYHSVG